MKSLRSHQTCIIKQLHWEILNIMLAMLAMWQHWWWLQRNLRVASPAHRNGDNFVAFEQMWFTNTSTNKANQTHYIANNSLPINTSTVMAIWSRVNNGEHSRVSFRLLYPVTISAWAVGIPVPNHHIHHDHPICCHHQPSSIVTHHPWSFLTITNHH